MTAKMLEKGDGYSSVVCCIITMFFIKNYTMPKIHYPLQIPPVPLIVAGLLHAVVIFGVSFAGAPSVNDVASDVATVFKTDTTPNEDARFIANASQVGGGEVRQQLRLETQQISPIETDSPEKVEDVLNLVQKTRQSQYAQSYLRTTLSIRHENMSDDDTKQRQSADLQSQEARLRKQIATLEAQLSQREQVFASATKIETVDSNSTTHGKAAAYLENFRNHVERVANQNYPAQARAQNIHGDVRLMVVILPSGEVKAIRLLESSGSVILDEAAKSSVRISAPYGKFSEEMKDIVELRIIRTWRYGDGLSVDY